MDNHKLLSEKYKSNYGTTTTTFLPNVDLLLLCSTMPVTDTEEGKKKNCYYIPLL